MNLETTVNRQRDLNYRLNDLTNQLNTLVERIAGKENIEEEIAKPELLPNGLLDELQHLQEGNKEILQEAERLLRRLSEATWMASTPVDSCKTGIS